MAARLIDLHARREELKAQHAELLKAAETDKRALTDAERESADKIQTEHDQVLATIKHVEQQLEMQRYEPAKAASTEPTPAPKAAKSENDFGSFGEFLQAVANVAIKGKVDSRLLGGSPQAAASGLNTSVPSEGGFLVRTEYSTALLNKAQEQAQLFPLCTRINIGEGADGLELPYIDETSRATGSRWGGVQVFRRAEADTVTATKPKFGKLELRLEDIMGIAYATERALRDAGALEQVISKSFASEFAFKVDDEIFRGTGVAQCAGLYPGGVLGAATVQQTKEAAQTADTVNAANVQKMFARVPARLIGKAVWLIGQEVWPQLFGMNQANMPVFMPGTSLANAPYGMLMGRPIFPIEQASAIGDLGDITLANMSEYLIIEKGGLQVAQSMHVRFLFGENTFRFTYPINGAPSWKSTLTPYKGAFSLSPFVGLEAR